MYCSELDCVCANCVPHLSENYEDPDYFACRGILTPKVVNVHMLNQKVLDIFPGQAHPPLNSVDTADEKSARDDWQDLCHVTTDEKRQAAKQIVRRI